LVNAFLTPTPCHFGTVNGNFANAPRGAPQKPAPDFLLPEKSFGTSVLRFVHEVLDSPPVNRMASSVNRIRPE
jgi:hypothetical protein